MWKLSVSVILIILVSVNCDDNTIKLEGKNNPEDPAKNNSTSDWDGKWFPAPPSTDSNKDKQKESVTETSSSSSIPVTEDTKKHESRENEIEDWNGKWFPNSPPAENEAAKTKPGTINILDSISNAKNHPSVANERAQFSSFPVITVNQTDQDQFSTMHSDHGAVMGVVSECDNALDNLGIDFDPTNSTQKLEYTCLEQIYRPDPNQQPLITLFSAPTKYVPIHKCMDTKLEYEERIPVLGPHRPLWLGFGEYEFAPVQRWLHNIEHGSIVMLYHPCANKDQVFKLKTLLTNCLYRHVITPYNKLSQEHPLALAGWGASLEMSVVDETIVTNFIIQYAKTGPEHTYVNGQYRHLLMKPASLVSDVSDTTVCPYNTPKNSFNKRK